MPEFLLPDLGEGLEDAEILAWHVGPGDRVEVDQVVVEVETAKAAVAVPVPFAGVVSAVHGAPGTRVRVGEPLLSVADGAEGFREPGVVGDYLAGGSVGGEADGGEGSGNVLIGFGTRDVPRRRRRRPVAPSSDTGHESSRSPRPSATKPPPASPASARARTAVLSPLVRRLARDANLDLAALAIEAPAGVVRRADVEAALALAGPAVGRFAPGSSDRRIPLTGRRKAAAEVFSRSRREIPEATVWVDVDATDLLAARSVVNAAHPDQPVSILALVARFAVAGLRRYPELNATVAPDAVLLHEQVNLGFAAQTERGLVVPVVHGAERMTTAELSAALTARTVAARDGLLTPHELTGGTFTVNNYGVFGVDGSAAIINHPEVAILGIGRIMDRPWAVDGEVVVRKVTQLTLAFDHRACDGGTAGGFLRFVADCVERPASALHGL